ncbi:MAG: hypothetical protein HZA07_03345 [Nitrospirae bacterium]|nr:hypothetical protein [Nitrospirota bacterium]
MEEQRLLAIDLSIASKELIEALIEDASEPAIFEEIAKANMDRPEILKLLIENPDTPEDVKQQVAKILPVPVVKPSSEVVSTKKTSEMRTQSLLVRIQKMSVSEKLFLALRGGKEIRSILIKDSNKEVVMNVLENPRITDSEIEAIARSRSIHDEALRKIARNREWMKNYGVILALVTNPKTPPGISVPLVSDLKTKDIIVLEKNKNVPDAVRVAAKKLLQWRKAH